MIKLKLYQPTNPFFIGQHFGESLACIKEGDGLLQGREVRGKILGACPTGFIELYPLLGLAGHNGLDCYALDGVSLYACQEGFVREISTEIERGLGVDVITNQKYQTDGLEEYNIKWRYWHLKGINVNLGQQVKIGDLIGWADSTGFSAGSHLHWECKKVIQDSNGWFNKDQTNGYYGAFDFEPFIVNEPAHFSWNFKYDIWFGQRDEEVKALQTILYEENLFPKEMITGFYGNWTRQAVLEFQKKYKVAGLWELLFLRGKKVGPKTRGKLNELSK